MITGANKAITKITCTLALVGAASMAAAEYPIAGTAPYQRPEGAPTITAVDHTEAWRDQALTGVSKPYPASLGFLNDQGNWYTPFNTPGMFPPYDIRGWHKTN